MDTPASTPPETGDVNASGAPIDDSTRDETGLTELEKRILAFEARWYKYAGAKEADAARELGISGTRYYQRLNVLLDNPAALAYAPVVVNRLRRTRITRLRARSAKRLGLE